MTIDFITYLNKWTNKRCRVVIEVKIDRGHRVSSVNLISRLTYLRMWLLFISDVNGSGGVIYTLSLKTKSNTVYHST